MEAPLTTLAELRAWMLRPVEGFEYFGERDLRVWGFAPFSVTRDADALGRSNWATVSGDLAARFPDAVEAIEVSHWAHGWARSLLVDTRDEASMAAVLDWTQRLEDHPVADDDLLAEEEFKERDAAWEDWGRAWVEDVAREEGIAELLGPEGGYGPLSEEDDERAREAYMEAMAHTGGDLDPDTVRRFLLEAFRPSE